MTTSPLEGISAIVSDLDGVVYRGEEPIPGAVAALHTARQRVHIVYATNNASRPPAAVADHLRELGLELEVADVVTSAMAGAKILHEALKALRREGPVLAVGGPGVAAAVQERGLSVVYGCDDATPPAGVLQGYGPGTPWSAFGEAAYAIARGAVWCLTNADRTIPTSRGIAPGNGMGGAAVAAATGATPLVAGKPETPIYELALEVTGQEAPMTLAVGDRLDTDIEGAVRLGMPSALVLTGVHDLGDVAAAPPSARPTYLLPDLTGLSGEYLPATGSAREMSCGAATAVRDGETIRLTGGSAIERARAAVALCWCAADAGQARPGELVASVPSWHQLCDEGEA